MCQRKVNRFRVYTYTLVFAHDRDRTVTHQIVYTGLPECRPAGECPVSQHDDDDDLFVLRRGMTALLCHSKNRSNGLLEHNCDN